MADNLTPQTWAATLLQRLGIHQTPGGVQALAGWAKAEGGHWNNNAKYNPLNTTQGASGAKSINSVGVKSYGSLQQGLDATVQTLQNGRYEKILNALRSGNPDAVGSAIGQTPWGTGGLVRNTIASTPRVAGVHALGAGAANGQNPSAGATNSSAGGGTKTTTSFDQAGYDKARKGAILADYLQKTNPNSTLLKAGVVTPGMPDASTFKLTKTTALTDHVTGRGYSDTTAGLLQTLTDRANKIDSKKLPYQWGGGHGAKPVTPGSSVPVDCSGAVSSVLGVNPRVSGEFAKWGKAGTGRVTVYANDKHVFMEINGSFFGTSASNPGGGAGWIPRSQISAGYLKHFTARHIDA